MPFAPQPFANLFPSLPVLSVFSNLTADAVAAMFQKRQFLHLAAALTAAAFLAACQKPVTDPAAVGATPAPRVLTIGTDPTHAPFESQNEKGEIVGFDIDVARAAARKAGLEVKFVSTPWAGAFAALTQGQRDLLASAVTITDQRRQTMDFSVPYFETTQMIAVPAKANVSGLNDLKKVRVGVKAATTGEEVVVKLLGKNSASIKRFESTALALADLAAGGVDAVVADHGVISHYLAHHPDAKFKAVADGSFEPEFYGLAFQKSQTELLTLFNQGIAGIKDDGSFQKIYEHYFRRGGAAK